MAISAIAGLVLGFGGVGAGAGLVHASERGGLFNFLEEMFRGPAPRPQDRVAAPRRPARYSSLPDARIAQARRMSSARMSSARMTPRVVANASDSVRRRARRAARSRTASAAIGIPALSARTVCVRACDGYLFPLGRLGSAGDRPIHEAACAAACPNAATSLFTMSAKDTELDGAVSADGQPYRDLPVAGLYRTTRVAQCSCQPEGVAATPLPIDLDLTARPGDVVATAASARVVVKARAGGFTTVDFREARRLTPRARRAIDAKIGVARREADDRAFRLALRQADRAPRVRVAQAGGVVSDVGGFEPPPAAADRGFSIVRVVAPSPYRR